MGVLPKAVWPIDRRDDVVAALLVGAVVVVLGYASGIGASTEAAASGTASSDATSTPKAVVPEPVSPEVVTHGASAETATAHSGMPMAMDVPPAAGMPTSHAPDHDSAQHTPEDQPPTPPTDKAPDDDRSGEEHRPGADRLGESACSPPDLSVAPVLSPLVDHVYTAHLERAPSDQVADATETGQYVDSHVSLLEVTLGRTEKRSKPIADPDDPARIASCREEAKE
jgi:hypothetical protein